MSGYTYFGKENKENFNKAIKKIEEDTGEKVKYIKYQSDMWRDLPKEEKEQWNEKVKVLNKANEEEGDNENEEE